MTRQIKLLLVEDNEGDIVLTVEALKRSEFTQDIQVVKDGQEALDYLHKEGRYENAEKPDLIFLDINLPKINGKEVLAQIKMNEDLKTIPVVMLTTSNSYDDVLESYRNHANSYITKPAGFNNFLEVIQNVKAFWINTVQLPTQITDEKKRAKL